jgi:hypothetical protein
VIAAILLGLGYPLVKFFEIRWNVAHGIDGTINVQDGQPVHADIPPIMKELDSWGFQLAVITGKKLDRVRRENLLGIAEVIDAAPEEQS